MFALYFERQCPPLRPARCNPAALQEPLTLHEAAGSCRFTPVTKRHNVIRKYDDVSVPPCSFQRLLRPARAALAPLSAGASPAPPPGAPRSLEGVKGPSLLLCVCRNAFPVK